MKLPTPEEFEKQLNLMSDKDIHDLQVEYQRQSAYSNYRQHYDNRQLYHCNIYSELKSVTMPNNTHLIGLLFSTAINNSDLNPAVLSSQEQALHDNIATDFNSENNIYLADPQQPIADFNFSFIIVFKNHVGMPIADLISVYNGKKITSIKLNHINSDLKFSSRELNEMLITAGCDNNLFYIEDKLADYFYNWLLNQLKENKQNVLQLIGKPNRMYGKGSCRKIRTDLKISNLKIVENS